MRWQGSKILGQLCVKGFMTVLNMATEAPNGDRPGGFTVAGAVAASQDLLESPKNQARLKTRDIV